MLSSSYNQGSYPREHPSAERPGKDIGRDINRVDVRGTDALRPI